MHPGTRRWIVDIAIASIAAITVSPCAAGELTRETSGPVVPPPVNCEGPAKSFSRSVSTSVGTFTVAVVEVPLSSHRLKVGLAQGKVGATQSLAQIAKQNNALVAVNGCFFDAYSGKAVRNPHGTLITGGQIVHIADQPTMIGQWANGAVAIGQARFKIIGAMDGNEKYPDNWYTYGINDTAGGSTWAALYTPLWSGTKTPADGFQAVVSNGKVIRTGTGPRTVPGDGFVVHLRGGEKYMANRFKLGRKCSFRIALKSASPQLDWLAAAEALGCGPLLVSEGRLSVDPQAEGFGHAKVLSASGARSAAGLTAGGRLLLVTCKSATIKQLAHIMKALGCQSAMNLDGGASSGLWFKGKYLTTPGRELSNALLVLPRPAGN